MKIVIAGAGEVGSHLARLLCNEEQDITLLDANAERLAVLDATLNLLTCVTLFVASQVFALSMPFGWEVPVPLMKKSSTLRAIASASISTIQLSNAAMLIVITVSEI